MREQALGVRDETPPPGADPAAGEEVVVGSATARAELAALCGGRRGEPLTLDRIAATLRQARNAQTQMIGRVTRYGVAPGPPRPEEVPLEVAAQALWLACDPILQEALTAAMEILGLTLNQVILGSLAFNRQDLVSQDQSLVPQASLAVQFGTRLRGRT